MVSMKSTDSIIAAVFGGVLVLYLIAAVFSDAAGSLQDINTSISGGSVIKTLLPLFLAFGVVIGVYRMFMHKK